MKFTITLSDETAEKLRSAAEKEDLPLARFIEKYNDEIVSLWQAGFLDAVDKASQAIIMPRKSGYSLAQEQCAEMERRLFR